MARKILIIAALVPESLSKHPNEIEQEILKEIHEGHLIIPWCYKIEKVKVISEKSVNQNSDFVYHTHL